MKTLLSFIVIIISINNAQARVFKCLDQKGQFSYGVVPCKKSAGSDKNQVKGLLTQQQKVQAEKRYQDQRNAANAKRANNYANNFREYRFTNKAKDESDENSSQ